MNRLIDLPFLIVSGKGGTGKSTLAIAIAHRLAAQGRRVLLVERGHGKNHQIGRLHYPLQIEPLSHEPKEIQLPGVKEKIWCSCMNPSIAMREYLELKFPLKGLVNLLFKSSLTTSFLDAIPGLPNLVTLGKIWYDLKQGTFDHVILDAPSSGHLLPLLSSPRTFKKITLAGPLFQDSIKIDDFFHAPEKMRIFLCALPEELVLKETLELSASLKGLDFSSYIVMNRKFPRPLPLPSKSNNAAIMKIQKHFQEKFDSEQECMKPFSEPFALTIPYFFSNNENFSFLQISKELQ